MTTRLILGLLILFALMQLRQIEKTNPAYPAENDFLNIEQPDKGIAYMLKQSCYDCHSFETKYPWYINVAPVSWWVAGHIRVGRENLNFSVWPSYSEKEKQHKIEEIIEEIELQHMPLKSYVWIHEDAKLTNEDREKLIGYFRSM